MKKRISLLIFFGMLMWTLVATAQMEVSSLSVDGRLPKDIKEVFVDSEGFLWYVTDGGLYQDDGYQTTCYRADIHRPNLMKSNHTTCLAEDAQGRIWIGTRRGAYMLDKRTYELAPVLDVEVVDHVVNTINVMSDGQLWLSTNEHLLRYDSCAHLVARYPISHKVSSIYIKCTRLHIILVLFFDILSFNTFICFKFFQNRYTFSDKLHFCQNFFPFRINTSE